MAQIYLYDVQKSILWLRQMPSYYFELLAGASASSDDNEKYEYPWLSANKVGFTSYELFYVFYPVV